MKRTRNGCSSSRAAALRRSISESCRIGLLATEGKTNEQIGEEPRITDKETERWRTRFVQKGHIGTEKDEPGRGRKLTCPEELRELIAETTTRSTPTDATQWSPASLLQRQNGRNH